MKAIESEAQLLASLNRSQREYYLRLHAERQVRLQTAMRDLARGLSAVSELNGEAQATLLEDASKRNTATGR